jgi:hypothetical protein
MDFNYTEAFGGPKRALEAYERLLHDVMLGERTLFTTAGGIERLSGRSRRPFSSIPRRWRPTRPGPGDPKRPRS